MPKIKVENIPVKIVDKICAFHRYYTNCRDCPLYIDRFNCYRKPKTDLNSIIELSEQDFQTNREWMESLSNEDLAALLTVSGLLIHSGKYAGMKASLSLITDKKAMLDWLSQPCRYLEEE